MNSHTATLLGADDRTPHPRWCAREPYCRVVDGMLTHASLPEQAVGVTLCLMQVAGTPPMVTLLNEYESLSVPADTAGGDLPDTLRRLSQQAAVSV